MIADGRYPVIDRKGNAYGRRGTTIVGNKSTSVEAFSSSDIKDTVYDIAIYVSDKEGIEGDITISSSLINDIEGAGGIYCKYIEKEGNDDNND